MYNLIDDGENYYFFRSFNDANKRDLEKGIKDIRTDCIRYYEEHKKWGKYTDKSKLSIEELYDHVKPNYREDTNCISLTSDASVALSYHPENAIYILVKYTKEEVKGIINAGDYYANAIKEINQNNIDKIGNVSKEELINTMERAYNSSEYIHYGNIPEEKIIACPKEYLEIFDIIQKAEKKGVSKEDIIKGNKQILKLIKKGMGGK